MKTLLPATLACALASPLVFAEPAQPTACLAAPNHLILSRANQDAASDFYQQLAATKSNVFFSPYSISSALAMVTSGARGDTEAEMRK
ncbi:MAG TPA: serpin family protein, partial [Luteolibacter sp.]|nr:serpin family protein [Luteolibacter sp.]